MVALIGRLRLQRKVYLTATGFSVVIPLEGLLLSLGGVLFILAAVLMILRSRREKDEKQLKMRVSGIKERFTDIKDESVMDGEDDWLEKWLKEDPDEHQRQMGMNEK